MQQFPVVLLKSNIEERINIIFQEYIIEALAEYQLFYGEEVGFQCWTEPLQNSIDKIQRRLGGLRHKELKSLLSNAIQQQISDAPKLHKE